MNVYLDLTELVANPLRSGIQRVEREVINHWPEPENLTPCFCVGSYFKTLPKSVFSTLCRPTDGTLQATELERNELAAAAMHSEPLKFSKGDRLLNLELFYDEERANAYIRLASQNIPIFWLVYDFLPYLRPELFQSQITKSLMNYIRALCSIGERVSFISEHTRSDYFERIVRRPTLNSEYPVFSLGADGLGLERQYFSPDKKIYACFGTIEPRKNQIALLKAVELLWSEGHDVHLALAGRLAAEAVHERDFLARYANESRLSFFNAPSDGTLRQILRRTRAAILPSEAEGFGLPPCEAVYSGIPAVVHDGLPSASLLGPAALKLPSMDVTSIASAIAALQCNETATALWAAAASTNLPTWPQVARKIAAWVTNASLVES